MKRNRKLLPPNEIHLVLEAKCLKCHLMEVFGGKKLMATHLGIAAEKGEP